MQLKNNYWIFTKAISKTNCDKIIKACLKQSKIKGTVANSKLKLRARNCYVSWISEDWIYALLNPFIHTANRNANWNFQWDWSEACQFTKYNKGQYYDWHCDSWEGAYNKPNDPNTHGKIRKLSVTLSLSDEKDYKGGELEFDLRNKDPDKKRNTMICKEIRPKGSLVVFPSFIWHRVRPVTKGSRYSLVIWNLGRPFQ